MVKIISMFNTSLCTNSIIIRSNTFYWLSSRIVNNHENDNNNNNKLVPI